MKRSMAVVVQWEVVAAVVETAVAAVRSRVFDQGCQWHHLTPDFHRHAHAEMGLHFLVLEVAEAFDAADGAAVRSVAVGLVVVIAGAVPEVAVLLAVPLVVPVLPMSVPAPPAWVMRCPLVVWHQWVVRFPSLMMVSPVATL